MATKKEPVKKATASKKPASVAKTVAPKKVAVKKAPAKKAPIEDTSVVTSEKVEAPKLSRKAKKLVVKEIGLLSKQEIIDTYSQKDGDTGSPEVQIALSSQKIENLSSHLKENPKDNHSRRGLLKIIAKRRRILHYLQDRDSDRYTGLIEKLGLKK